MTGYVLFINENLIEQQKFIKYILSRKHTFEDLIHFNKCFNEGKDLLKEYNNKFGVKPFEDLLTILTLDDVLCYENNKIIWPMSRPFEVMDEERNIDYFTMYNIFDKLQSIIYGKHVFDIYYKE